MNGRIARKNQIIEELTNENSDLSAKISEWSTHSGHLGNTIGDLKSQIGDLNEQLIEQSTRSGHLGNIIGELRKQNRDLTKEANEQTSKINKWSKRCGNLQNQIQQLKMHTSKLQSKWETNMFEKMALTDENKMLKERNQSLQVSAAENEMLKKQIQVFQGTAADCKGLKNDVATLKNQNEELVKKIAELKISVCENGDAADFFKGVCDARVTEIQRLKSRMQFR